MKWLRPDKRRLVASLFFSSLVFTALLLWLKPINQLYALQDAMFMTGLLFIIVAGFRISAATGLFDMISYGYNRFGALFRQDKNKQESFFEYAQNKSYVVRWEPLIVGLAFLACSLALRLAI